MLPNIRFIAFLVREVLLQNQLAKGKVREILTLISLRLLRTTCNSCLFSIEWGLEGATCSPPLGTANCRFKYLSRLLKNLIGLV